MGSSHLDTTLIKKWTRVTKTRAIITSPALLIKCPQLLENSSAKKPLQFWNGRSWDTERHLANKVSIRMCLSQAQSGDQWTGRRRETSRYTWWDSTTGQISPEPSASCRFLLFSPPASSNKLNYWNETDPFCLKLRLKDSSSKGCLLSLIKTSGLSFLTPKPHQTSPVSNSAPSSPDRQKAAPERLTLNWHDSQGVNVEESISMGRPSRIWEVVSSLQGCPIVSWQAIQAIFEWHKTQGYLTSHGWS